MGKAHEQTFPQQRYTNAPKIHEKMFTIFVEMQIKTMKYHFIPIRIAIKQTKLEKKKTRIHGNSEETGTLPTLLIKM